MPGHVHIAEDIRRLLTPAELAKAITRRDLTFGCCICHTEGRLDPDNPASLILYQAVYIKIISYAHPGCSPSRIIHGQLSRMPLLTEEVTVTLWLRPQWCEPRATVLCRLAGSWCEPVGTDDRIDWLTAGLMERGFAMLTSQDDPLPELATLNGRIEDDHLDVTGPTDAHTTLIHTTLFDEDHWWIAAALDAGLVGVVMVTGANTDPTVEPMPELHTAIRAGRAVGATAPLRP